MSKERELLQRILDYMWEGELADEIKELLAQPEQEPTNFDLKRELSDEQKRLAAIAIKQREAHGIGGGE